MYNFIIEEINKKINHGKKDYFLSKRLKQFYLLVLYLKFKCNQNNITDFNNPEKLKELITEDKLSLYHFFFEHKLYEVMIYLHNADIQELLDEFISREGYNQFEKVDNLFIEENDKVVYFYKELLYANRLVIRNIDSTTFVPTIIYNMIDEMKGKTRTFFNRLDNIDFKDINTIVIIYPDYPYRYISTSRDFIEIISEIIFNVSEFKGRIILKTPYSNISILKEHFLVKSYLTKVILYEDSNKDDAILVFDKDNNRDKISIMMINKDIENDDEQIKKIIDDDISDKKNLIKVDPEKIISNNYRIGFRMYLTNKSEEIKSINDIIDENTRIIEKITRLNKEIQEEMNKLISK